MPAILTHDFFGQDAFGPALQSVGLYTPDERDAFLLGNQGPDPLFYLAIIPPLGAFEQLGSDIHHDAPDAFLASMRLAVDELPNTDRGVGRAYLAGFVCHYLLDRAEHPLVYYWERGICHAGVEGLDDTDKSKVHAEIERDLDEMVLYAKRSQTVAAYRPYRNVLRGSDEVLSVIGDVWYSTVLKAMTEAEPSANKIYPIAVDSFRLVQTLFYSPGERRARVFERLERFALHQRHSLVRAMMHRVREEATSDFDNRERLPWRNPFTGQTSTQSFWDLYEAALDEVAPAIAKVFSDGFDEQAAHELTRGLNFSGEPVA